MSPTTKRTYRLTERAQTRVREMTSRYSVAGSQDAVVELAVAQRWADAANDPDFQAERADVARAFADVESWPA